MMSASPSFSVVIPTCHRDTDLARCLERLAPGVQTLAPETYEVIVSDDGTASTAEALMRDRFPWARWVQGPRRGPAANRNYGASIARGEWVVFTDDDCVPEPGWLAGYAGAARGDVRALEGRVFVRRAREHPFEFSPVNEKGGLFWSCNIAMRRTAFAEIGGFDERFPFAAMEDMDLRLRLQARGWERQFVPAAAVEHPWRRIEDWDRHFKRHLQSRIIFEELHPGQGLFSLPRFFVTYARVALYEQLPWLLRRPGVMLRRLPLLWKAIAIEGYVTWRRPTPAEFARRFK